MTTDKDFVNDPAVWAGHQLRVYRESDSERARPEAVPVSPEQLEAKAAAALPKAFFDYIAGGAGSEDTQRENLAAFGRVRIVPRMLCDVSGRDTSVELFGRVHPTPILLAPIGVQRIARPSGELLSARAAASVGVVPVVSTAISCPLEDVAAAVNSVAGSAWWYQMYWPADEELTASFLARAEAGGASAVVVTLDTTTMAWRERDLANGYLPFLIGDGLGMYFSDPVFRSRLAVPPEQDLAAAVELYFRCFYRQTRTWADVASLRKRTRLPILLKGILHADDAMAAIDAGADGVIVSNHGGRQVDGGIAAFDALGAVTEEVADRVPVLFDSGIRRGADVFKALARGARAVLLGRPFMYGLAVGGEAGVRRVLLNLMTDFALTLTTAGKRCVADISDDDLFEHGCC